MVRVDMVISKFEIQVGNIQVLQLAFSERGSFWEEYWVFPGTFLLAGVNRVLGIDPENSKGC